MAYPPRYRTRPEKFTWLGRHHQAMQHVTERFKDAKGRVVAWVVGIGGMDESYPSTEHIELALALEKANADYHIHAMDNNSGVLKRAKAASRLREICATAGIRRSQTGQCTIRLPDGFQNRVSFHGPLREGDIFRTNPVQRPNLITCFNVAMYYDGEEQKMLADLLAQAIHKDGMLMTTVKYKQTDFTERLKKLFGKAEIIGQAPYEQADIIAFSSPKTGLIERLARLRLKKTI